MWQVSHHPPIGVGHGENENWTYDIVSAPSTKFLGNSVEVYPIGMPLQTPPSTDSRRIEPTILAIASALEVAGVNHAGSSVLSSNMYEADLLK